MEGVLEAILALGERWRGTVSGAGQGRLYIFWGPWTKSKKAPLTPNIYVRITVYKPTFTCKNYSQNLSIHS
jgi:hypothetical protein